MTNTKKTRPERASVTLSTPAAGRKAPSARSTARPAAAVAAAPNPAQAKSELVRDSFTIPKSEYAVLEGLKLRAAGLTRPTKKSELLRAGIAVLSGMSDRAFLAALSGVPSLKTGRPKGSSANAQ
jgi:hypothetical protein